jgi:glycerol uptake facilitator-like aquaporin
MNSLKPAIAELIGTFALTFIGAMAIANGQAGLVGVAFAHGLTLMIMVYALGAISGAHVNPAVTLGLALGKKSNGTPRSFTGSRNWSAPRLPASQCC